jgi:hypothetical protein
LRRCVQPLGDRLGDVLEVGGRFQGLSGDCLASDDSMMPWPGWLWTGHLTWHHQLRVFSKDSSTPFEIPGFPVSAEPLPVCHCGRPRGASMATSAV